MPDVKNATLWILRGLNILQELVLTVFFPKNQTVLKLEKMDDEEFLNSLPKATSTKHDCHSLFLYRNVLVKTAIWELKYKKNYTIAKRIGNALHKKLSEEILPLFSNPHSPQPPLVIPIPISKKRRKERGFNQCEIIVHALPKSELYTISTIALRKVRDTPRQTISKRKKDREENIKGCFDAEKNLVCGRDIILIDDVLTTGSTLREAEKVLYESGARQIIRTTIAR